MSTVNLSWSADGVIDSYNIYRSASPMNVASLPTPLATGITTKSYSDNSMNMGSNYYYRVGSIKASIEKVSSEIRVNLHTISSLAPLLFASAEKGAIFDFNNLSTMFQDIAGTIPVTAVGQDVRKVQDLSGNGNHLVAVNSGTAPKLAYDSIKKVYYIYFDGSTSMMYVPSLNFAGVTKFSLFASITRELTTAQVICELSSNYNNNPGSFIFNYDAGNAVAFATRGSGSYPTGYNSATITSSVGGTFSVITDIALSSNKIKNFRLNGVDKTINSKLDNSIVAISSYPLYVGGRGDGTLKTKARYYSLVVLARLASTSEIQQLEEVQFRDYGG